MCPWGHGVYNREAWLVCVCGKILVIYGALCDLFEGSFTGNSDLNHYNVIENGTFVDDSGISQLVNGISIGRN